MDAAVLAICRQEGLACRSVQPLSGGQVNRVYRVDDEYVLRIGMRADAVRRLRQESALLRSLAGQAPVPPILAAGELDGLAYQIQRFVPGEKLHNAWGRLSLHEQENVAAELAEYMGVLHSRPAQSYGYTHEDTSPGLSWGEYLLEKFRRTLADIETYQIRFFPGVLDLAADFLRSHLPVLEDSAPVLVHSDLTFVNVLVAGGKVSALLDFEYAMHAPRDYELWAIEAFCLFPNDYAEEDNEVFCTADFAGFFPLLRKHAPGLFAIPNLRQRVDVYHVEAALSSYVAWRKANLDRIPAQEIRAKEFYLGRIGNFIYDHGARLF